MNFNKILRSLFGDKASRDMKLIQPVVEQVKAAYPAVNWKQGKLLNNISKKELEAWINGLY